MPNPRPAEPQPQPADPKPAPVKDEFEDGCEKGWVQEKPSEPADASGGDQTPAAPQKPQP